MGLVAKQPDDEEHLEQITITGFGPLDGDGPPPVGIDLRSWGSAGRTALDERLHLLEAPHAWSEDGGILVVPEDAAAWIARIIETVEDERTVQLDPDEEQIGYDLAGWDDDNRATLLARLEDQEIPYAIEEEELVVLEIDEQRVDELVDAILEPDGPTADAAGGEARPELMGELFVAADRLVHDASDHEGRGTLTAGAVEAAAHAPPYGMDKVWWRDLADRLDAFQRLLNGGIDPEHEDAAVTTAATELRDLLRPYV